MLSDLSAPDPRRGKPPLPTPIWRHSCRLGPSIGEGQAVHGGTAFGDLFCQDGTAWLRMESTPLTSFVYVVVVVRRVRKKSSSSYDGLRIGSQKLGDSDRKNFEAGPSRRFGALHHAFHDCPQHFVERIGI